MTNPNPTILRIDAAAIADAHALHAPGSLLLELSPPGGVCVLAVGPPDHVGRHPAAREGRTCARPNALVIPGLVNAHTHLDLTLLGPRDVAGSFADFVELVRSGRPREDEAIAAGVRAGVDLSRRGGVVAVGDIAGCPPTGPTLVPYDTLAASGLAGVSFIEFFAIGASRERGMEAARSLAACAQAGLMRAGLQPHAPYSVAGKVYEAVASKGKGPLATHLAETRAEIELVARGTGEFRAFLERLGLWDASCEQEFGHGRTPVAHVLGALGAQVGLGERGLLAAHVNAATDDDIALLAASGSSVAYCPRASAYFRAPEHLGAHRYREMLEAGVNVALGTDSIINLDTPGRISTLDEMRLLYRRDKAPASTLLAMGTTRGAVALGLDEAMFRFEVGSRPLGVVGVRVEDEPADPLAAALLGSTMPELLIGGDS